MLKKCFNAKDEISTIFDVWSFECPVTAIDISIENGDKAFLTELIRYFHDDNLSNRNAFKPPDKLSYIETGETSLHTFGGIRTRALNMSRGGKLGNNAFLDDVAPTNVYSWIPRFSINLMKLNNFDVKLFDLIHAATTNPLKPGDNAQQQNISNNLNFTINIHNAARLGNYKTVNALIKQVAKLQNYGFNDLHHQVLEYKDDKFEVQYRVSINKKSVGNFAITPIHLACINPHEKVVKRLIELGGDWNICDLDLKKPIHYAAACESAGPLNVLLAMGGNCNENDKSKFTPLMMAAQAGREENVKVLLMQKNIIPMTKIKSGHSAIHFAVENNRLGVLKMLIEVGKYDINLPGPERMTPLIMAAKYGHEECLDYLIANGAGLQKKDKFKRTALILAIKGGHSKIASILLRKGANCELADNSNNFPLHYACAYGWMECVQLLLSAEASVNSTNSWKISCIEIAMLKNHFGIVKYLLNNTEVDINIRFDRGNTLLIHSIIALNEKTFSEVEYLVKEKKADVNLQNIDGKSVIHMLAEYTFEKYIERNGLLHLLNPNYFYSNINNKYMGKNLSELEKKEVLEEQKRIHSQLMINLITLFKNHNVDINLKTNKGKTPLQIGIELKNLSFLHEIIRYNPGFLFFDRNNECILHLLPNFLFDEHGEVLVRSILDKLTKIDCTTIANLINKEGFSPLIKLFIKYEKDINGFYEVVYNKQIFKYKEDLFEKGEAIKKEKSSQNHLNKEEKNKIIEEDEKLELLDVEEEEGVEEVDEEEDLEDGSNDDEEEGHPTKTAKKTPQSNFSGSQLGFVGGKGRPTNIKLTRDDKINKITLNDKDLELVKTEAINSIYDYLNNVFFRIVKDFTKIGCDPRIHVLKMRKFREKVDGEEEEEEEVENLQNVKTSMSVMRGLINY